MVTVKAKWMPYPVTGNVIYDAFDILIIDTGKGWYSMRKDDVEV